MKQRLSEDGWTGLTKTVELLKSKEKVSVEEAKFYLRCMGYSDEEVSNVPTRTQLAEGLFLLYTCDGTTMPRLDKNWVTLCTIQKK